MATLVSKRHPGKKMAKDEYVVLRTGVVNKLDRMYPYDVVADAVSRYNAKPTNYGVMDTSIIAHGTRVFTDHTQYSHRAEVRMVGQDLVAKILPLHGTPNGNILANLITAKSVEFTTASSIKDKYVACPLGGKGHMEIVWMELIAIYSTPVGLSANTP